MLSNPLQSQTVSGEIVSLFTFSGSAIENSMVHQPSCLFDDSFVSRLVPQPLLHYGPEGSAPWALFGMASLFNSVSLIFAEIKRLLALYFTYACFFLSSQRLSTLNHFYGCKRIRNTSDLRLLNRALSIEC